MLRYMLIAAVLLASTIQTGARANDVTPDHWAYQAVNDLAEAGLVLGYPDGRFLGDRSLTRYEMASLVKRVLDEMDRRTALTNAGEKDPRPDTPTAGSDADGVSQQDLARVAQLVEEYKVELAIIGADLAKARTDIEDLRTSTRKIMSIVEDHQHSIDGLQRDVGGLKKITLSGYVQSRYEAYEGGEEGSLAADNDSFYVRRARLKVSARPGARTGAVVYFDADRGRAGVKEAYVEYYPSESTSSGPYYRLGQFLWPFGYEVWEQSSSARETPERAIVNRTLFPGERDRGVAILGPSGRKLQWVAGVFNGTGVGRTAAGEDLNTAPADDNTHKDVAARLKFRPSDRLGVGISGYLGEAVTSVTTDAEGNIVSFVETDKTRWGVDVQYSLRDSISLKGEYIGGRDRGFSVDGWWTQLAYSPTLRDTLVGKYDRYDDGNPASTSGVLSAWNLGWIRQLSDSMRLKVFHEINREERNTRDNDGWRVEVITRY